MKHHGDGFVNVLSPNLKKRIERRIYRNLWGWSKCLGISKRELKGIRVTFNIVGKVGTRISKRELKVCGWRAPAQVFQGRISKRELKVPSYLEAADVAEAVMNLKKRIERLRRPFRLTLQPPRLNLKKRIERTTHAVIRWHGHNMANLKKRIERPTYINYMLLRL